MAKSRKRIMRSERQGLERMTKFTHQSAYRAYVKKAGKNALDYPTYDRIIRKFFKQLSVEIIVDKYEWKMPYGLGYMRIAKNKKGEFYWRWDVFNPYTRIKKRALWSFKAAVDWVEKKVGKRGLMKHYYDCKNDLTKSKYDVPNIRHFVRGFNETI